MPVKRRADGPPSTAQAASASGSVSGTGATASAAKRLRFAQAAAAATASPAERSDKYASALGTLQPSATPIAEEDDHTGDIELEEQDRKRAQQGRKGRVVTEMSDSESEDEEGGEGAGKHADEDEDMFAADADSDKEKASKADRTKNLQKHQIEGQEFGKRTRAPDQERADLEAGEDSEPDIQDLDPDFELESSDEEGDEGGEAEAAKDEAAGEGEGDDKAEDGEPPEAGPKKRSKKLKKGMGYKIEAFNVEAEMESGHFDEDGNYVAKAKDPHAEHDSWLQGTYNRKAIKAARDAAKRREQEERAKAIKEQDAALSPQELQKGLAELMHRGETVMEALRRLGDEAKKHRAQPGKKQGWRSKKGKEKAEEGMEMDEETTSGGKAGKHPSLAALDNLTDYSSELMSEHGMMGIYDATYEELVRAVRRGGGVSKDWDPAPREEAAPSPPAETLPSNGDKQNGSAASAPAATDEPQYSYRWAPAYLAATAQASGQPVNPEIETFGPYPLSSLKEWSQSGYFGTSNERILLRKAGEGDRAPWLKWTEIIAS